MHNQLREPDPLIDKIDFAAAKRLARATSLLDGQVPGRAGGPMVFVNPRSLRGRFGYLRAAFVGDVRMSFMAIIMMAAIFLSGWLVASHFAREAEAEREQRERLELRDEVRANVQFQLHKEVSRVRQSEDANQEYVQFLEELYERLNESWSDLPD